MVERITAGVFPDDPEALRELPGVGRYIAGALLSFAFDRPAPIVEANTQRVLARWLAWGERAWPRPEHSQARLWRAAGRLVPRRGGRAVQPGVHGAGGVGLHPEGPDRASLCPVAADCRARALGIQDTLPKKSAKAKLTPLAVAEACALVDSPRRPPPDRQDARRAASGQGFWEFPTDPRLAGADPAGRSLGEPVELAEGLFRRLTGRAGPRVEPGGRRPCGSG